MPTIRFKGTRADVTRTALFLARMLSGKAADTFGIAESFQLTLGFAALSDIKDAYLAKAAGGRDEMGIKWPPLDPKTIANRRVGARDLRNAEVKRYTTIRKRETRKAMGRFMASGLDDREAMRRARFVGTIKANKEVGKTKVEILGSRRVEILRDIGRLLTSLSPGILSGSGNLTRYSPPNGDGGEKQIFETLPGQLIVGTNVIYASTHQHGDQSRNIPQRKILPDDTTPVPTVWWDRWLRIANQSLALSAALLFRRGAL